MSSLVDFVYIALALSIPFMFGMVVGRGIRRPAETLEHRFGSRIIAAVTDVQSRRKFIGDGFLIRNTLTIQAGERTIEIEVREPA